MLLISMLLTAGISSSIIAQLPANNDSSIKQSTSETISPVKSNGVRITSPIGGEQISSDGKNYFNKNGENLSINGFSVYEKNNRSDCKVFVIVNNVKPYQLTNPTGKAGNGDYSTWQFNFNSFYTPFKEGSNKITSKLTCQPGNTNSFYSVNVTGSTINGIFPSQAKTPLVIGNNSSASVFSIKQTNTTSTPPTNITGSINLNPKSGEIPHVGPSALTPPTTSAAPLKQTNTTSTPPTSNTGPINLNPKSGEIPHVGPSALTPPNKNTGPINLDPKSGASPNTAQSTPSTPTENTGPINLNPKSGEIPHVGPSALTPPNKNTGPINLNPKSGASPNTAQSTPSTPTENTGTINLNPKSDASPTIGQPTTSKQLGLKSLDINIDSKGSGDDQEFVITVQDSTTSAPVNGASINGKINSVSFSGKTDSDGEFSDGLPSSVESSPSVDVAVTVNANGYKSNKADTTLAITPDIAPDSDTTYSAPDSDTTYSAPDSDTTDSTPDSDTTYSAPDSDTTDSTPDSDTTDSTPDINP